MILVNKFFTHLRENGLILSLLKVCDYLAFKLNRNENSLNPLTLKKGALWLVLNQKGISILHQEFTLTQNIGFHSAIKNLETLHDSTQADWEILFGSESRMVLAQRWWNLPIQQLWEVSLEGENRIRWITQMIVENIISLEEIKLGIILHPLYSWVKISEREIPLPSLDQEWAKAELGIPQAEIGNEIILKNEGGETRFPSFKFSVGEAFAPYEFIVQNTNNYLNGRYLQLGFLNEQEFPSGKYKLAEIYIELKKL